MIVVAATAGILVSAAPAFTPPGSLGSVSLAPLPAAGKVRLFQITVSGHLEAGVKKPTINLELGNSSVIRGKLAVAAEGWSATKGGTTTVTFLVAVSNGAVRTKSSVEQGDAIDMIVFGSTLEWGPAPAVKSGDEPCARARNYIGFKVRADYTNYWQADSNGEKYSVSNFIAGSIKSQCP